MRRSFIILLIINYSLFSLGQDIPPATEQQLESLTDIDQIETEDDSYLQQLEHFKKHPLNLNETDAGELRELTFLTDLQIENLVSYRNLLGKLISIYELQAIPGWDIVTIKKILPFVAVGNAAPVEEDVKKRLKHGDHNFLIRFSEPMEEAKGFDPSSPGTKYLGGKEKIFFRYRYKYKNLLQYGMVGDKDAGEQFLKGAEKSGFDFYSFHLFVRNAGKVRALALGDFSVNMGQGLIQWQSLAFKKSSEVLGVKRQSTILRPYNSSGEFYFHRGAGITIQSGKMEATAYATIRKLSANLIVDTANNRNFITSFLNSGYHRTQNEIDDRNEVRQISFGGNVTYRRNNWHIGANAVVYKFSLPIQKKDEPYNLFAISGKNWSNFSVDYSYTFRNLHFFGEAATDKNLDLAFVNGLLISVDPRVDLAVVHRSINKEYQAVYGNAFTENTYPTNERGLYTGVTIRPYEGWRLDMYADFYEFPWLKYLIDAPGYGKDFLAQLSFNPGKQLEIYSRVRSEAKQTNQFNSAGVTNYLVLIPKKNWRTEWSYKIDRQITIRNRVEIVWYGKKVRSAGSFNREINSENGFLSFLDIIYKPSFKPYSGIIRLQYFETDGYNSRIYAYENDVLYSYSIPALFGKGYHYYFNFNYDLMKNLSMWLRWSQTIYPTKNTVGSGLDGIAGNKRSEIKFQAILIF